MNQDRTIYYPYRVIEDRHEKLELGISSGREKFLFVFYRLMPLIFIAMAVIVYKIFNTSFGSSSEPVLFIYGFPGVLFLSAALILMQSFIIGVIFTPDMITLYINGFPGFRKEITVLVPECESIFYTITGGRGGGGFIYIRMRNGKKIQVVNIPIFYLHSDAIPQICDEISKRTGLPAENP